MPFSCLPDNPRLMLGIAKMRILEPALFLTFLAQILGVGLALGEPAKVLGSWRIEVAFENGENRFFQFDAAESGKATLQLLDPRLSRSGPPGSSAARWIEGDDGTVTFSGPVEFPLGNVGRDPGTLVLKGKPGPDGSISGGAAFFPQGHDPNDPQAKPGKSGTFKAIRGEGAPSSSASATP